MVQILDRIASMFSDNSSLDQSHRLVLQSPYRSRIQELLADPARGTLPLKNSVFHSNCHGTLLYLLGFEDQLSCYDPYEMEDFLEHNCLPKENGEIAAFYLRPGKQKGGLMHTALNLGTANQQVVLFHQPNTGERHTLDTLETYYNFLAKNRLSFTPVFSYFYSLGEGNHFTD